MATSDIFNLTDTWNAGATTFTAIKMNVTDTASASASLLMDLQVGGTGVYSFRKDGFLTVGGASSAIYVSTIGLGYAGAGLLTFGATNDLTLRRAAAASLQLGAADAAAPVAQTLGVQSVVAGTSNTAGTNFTIKGSAGTGTGAGGSLIFQVAPAGSSGSAQNAFSAALTIASDQSASFAGSMSVSSFALITSFLQASYFRVGASDCLLNRDAANTLALRNGTSAQQFNVYNTYTDASNYSRLSFQGFTGAGGFGITSQAAGTGSLLAIRLIVAGNQNIYFDTNSTTRLFVDYSGHVGTGTDNTTDLGETTLGTRRFRNIYAGTSITPGAGVTVASLPTPTTGMVARVTNALAPAVGATVAGGGAAQALVWYNGANWTVIGV